jgi:hypothetical protein
MHLEQVAEKLLLASDLRLEVFLNPLLSVALLMEIIRRRPPHLNPLPPWGEDSGEGA